MQRRSRFLRRRHFHKLNTDTNFLPFLFTTLHKNTKLLRLWRWRHLPIWTIRTLFLKQQRKPITLTQERLKIHHSNTPQLIATILRKKLKHTEPWLTQKDPKYLTIPQYGHCHPGGSWISDPRKPDSKAGPPGPDGEYKYRPRRRSELLAASWNKTYWRGPWSPDHLVVCYVCLINLYIAHKQPIFHWERGLSLSLSTNSYSNHSSTVDSSATWKNSALPKFWCNPIKIRHRSSWMSVKTSIVSRSRNQSKIIYSNKKSSYREQFYLKLDVIGNEHRSLF